MKKSELLQLIKEELENVLAEINSVEDIEDKAKIKSIEDIEDKAKTDLMNKLKKILDDAKKSLGPSEVAKVIDELYQQYKNI